MATLANLALEGGDPRDPHHPIAGDAQATELAMLQAIHDPNIKFEEYLHYATITRAEEKAANERFVKAQGPKTWKTVLKNRFSSGRGEAYSPELAPQQTIAGDGKTDEKIANPQGQSATPYQPVVTDVERKRASRAVRTAGWSGMFYLITTDILGPFSTPWSFAQMGYGPGVALYTVFGLFAAYSGFQLWKIFLAMDSDRYPLKVRSLARHPILG